MSVTAEIRRTRKKNCSDPALEMEDGKTRKNPLGQGSCREDANGGTKKLVQRHAQIE